jgi:uncharacterized lipoprotein YehR (DUF1307 family)
MNRIVRILSFILLSSVLVFGAYSTGQDEETKTVTEKPASIKFMVDGTWLANDAGEEIKLTYHFSLYYGSTYRY